MYIEYIHVSLPCDIYVDHPLLGMLSATLALSTAFHAVRWSFRTAGSRTFVQRTHGCRCWGVGAWCGVGRGWVVEPGWAARPMDRSIDQSPVNNVWRMENKKFRSFCDGEEEREYATRPFSLVASSSPPPPPDIEEEACACVRS